MGNLFRCISGWWLKLTCAHEWKQQRMDMDSHVEWRCKHCPKVIVRPKEWEPGKRLIERRE